MSAAGDARLAKIASPFIKRTPVAALIAENTFTLAEAAALIPMNSKGTLTQWLFRNKHRMPAPRYRDISIGTRTVQIRVLTVDEIKHIRNIIMFGRSDERYRGLGVNMGRGR
jgi:hypothetical protein